MIVIIDYDMGNIASIKNMLHVIGTDDVIVSGLSEDVEKADKIILPGVGAFDFGIQSLQKRGLIEAIRNAAIEEKKPVLGICLGMQLLGESSEEGCEKGLALIPFHTERFRLETSYKIPHMGWDDVMITVKDHPFVSHMQGGQNRFYFVHSYHAVCHKEEDVMMVCHYGYDFPAAIYKDNIYGVQFHPEKSHRFGMQLLRGFVSL